MGVPEGPGFDEESSDDEGLQATLTDQQVSLDIYLLKWCILLTKFYFFSCLECSPHEGSGNVCCPES